MVSEVVSILEFTLARCLKQLSFAFLFFTQRFYNGLITKVDVAAHEMAIC